MTSYITPSPRSDVANVGLNFLIFQWSVRMVRVNNYETVSKFDNVMPRIL